MRAAAALLLAFAASLPPASLANDSKVTDRGYWLLGKQRNGTYFVDTGLADGVANIVLLSQQARPKAANGPATLLDFGAGMGGYVRYWQERGISTHGFEGAPDVEQATDGLIQRRDLTEPFSQCVAYEWVTCLEVAEHIPRKFEVPFLANLNCSVGRVLVMSWAPPGQGGTGHINLRSRDYVVTKLQGFGFEEDVEASRKLQESSIRPWFRKNTIVLRRKPTRIDK